mgnify:CR=1 FL=1
MIKYALRCGSTEACGCVFDGWFKNADACQTLLDEKRLTCPSCNSNLVEKSLQSPHLANSAGKKRSVDQPENAASAPATKGKTNPLKTPTPNKIMTPEAAEAYKKVYDLTHKLQEHVKANCDDVGKDFAEMARKIHYNEDTNSESQTRGIYGQVTETDAKDLVEEGISIMPLPQLPKSDS